MTLLVLNNWAQELVSFGLTTYFSFSLPKDQDCHEMWCKNRKKIIKEMKQRGEDPSVLLPARAEMKQSRPVPKGTSQKEVTPVDRSRNLPRVPSQKELTPVDRGRTATQTQPGASGTSKSSGVSQTMQYKDPSTEIAFKNSPAKVSSRSEPFAPYVKPTIQSEQFAPVLKQSVSSEMYSPVVKHSAPAMPPALLTHPSSASVVSQSTTITSVKSSSSLPSLHKQVSEPEPPVLHTSSLSAPHSAHQTREPSPEDPTLPLKFMDITQFKAPEDLEEEDKMGEHHHHHESAPPTEAVPPSSVEQSVPNLDPDMHQLTMMLQQGGSVQDVANSLNITLDEHTSGLLNTLKQQLDLAATLQNKPVLPIVHSSIANVSSEGSHSVAVSVQDSSYNQATSRYEYNTSSYSDSYSSSAYSQGYGQTEPASGADRENGGSSAGVKAALANLLVQQSQSLGETDFSQEDPYSQKQPIYAQAHGHEETYYSNSSQPDYGGNAYHKDRNLDPMPGHEPTKFPSESMITNTGPTVGVAHGGTKSFSYGNGNSAVDTNTVESMTRFSYGSESSFSRNQSGGYQKYGSDSRSDSTQQFSYGSDNYSSSIDNDGGMGSGSLNRRRTSNSGTGLEFGSGEGMGRNLDSGPGFSGRGGYGQRAGSFGRSEGDGAGQGPVSLLGSPPFRHGGGPGSAGKSFGRQLSDEGTPRGKNPGGGLLGARPAFGGGHFGSGRGSSQGPRPLMSFDIGRGRSDRGKYRGNWK